MTGPQTWHHGFVAEWWANFNTDGPEIDYFRRHVEDEQPVLDAGCGTGRLLVPWLQAGIDADGCDVSADMIELCRRRARKVGYEPTLFVQPLHALDPPRRYRSVVVCGAFGLGSTRAEDEEALRRLHAALEPGGTLLLDNQVPYSNASTWARWAKPGRDELPTEWSPLEPEWRRADERAEYALQARIVALDPLEQSTELLMRAQKRVEGEVVGDEEHRLTLHSYFRDELLMMLRRARFSDVCVEAGYSGREPTADDDFLVFIARR